MRTGVAVLYVAPAISIIVSSAENKDVKDRRLSADRNEFSQSLVVLTDGSVDRCKVNRVTRSGIASSWHHGLMGCELSFGYKYGP